MNTARRTRSFTKGDAIAALVGGSAAKPKSPQVGRIRIVAVERQRLGDITPESVKREGHKSLEEFKEAWLEAHGLSGTTRDERRNA